MSVITTISGSLISVDLLTRDFEGYRYDALKMAETTAPSWTDRSELDMGVVLTELFAFMADNLSFYQDRIANEAMWRTAVLRRSIIEQARLIGYELHPAVSAQVLLTIVANGAGTIPAGAVVSVDTSDGSTPAEFEIYEAQVFAGAETRTGVIALHGRTVSEVVGSSLGTAGQTFALSSKPLARNPLGSSSLVLYVDDGGGQVAWTEVENFLQSESTDEVYRITIDESDVVTIHFGDGVNGKIPPAGVDNIEGVYRVGGGLAGNAVGPNRLRRLAGSYNFVTSVTNPAQPSGGDDKESIEAAKENAPQSLISGDRAVRHADYAAAARRVPGVSRAHAYIGSGRYEEVVVISAAGSNPIPTGTWNPRTETGTGLIGSVGSYVTARKSGPVRVKVIPCSVAEFILAFDVYLQPMTRRRNIGRLIENAVFGEYDVSARDFGEQVAESSASDVICDVRGVRYIDLLRFQRVPYARKLIETTSEATFGSFVYGTATQTDRWTIQFTSNTTFTVMGANDGPQTATGTAGTPYLVDDGSFGFTISDGGVDPTVGEMWEVITGAYKANIDPSDDELVKLHGNTFLMQVYGGIE